MATENNNQSTISRPKSTISHRLIKSIIVGLVATAVDFALLFFFVQCFHWPPAAVNVLTLVIGSSIQFQGHRAWVFAGQKGSLSWQIPGFILAEALSISLNAVAYFALVTWTPFDYRLSKLVSGLVIYLGISFPTWSVVFRHRLPADQS